MDLETPVDAWYVWVGVSLAGVALAGVAIGLPAQPPPDAAKAANAIDRAASSSHQAAVRYEHDAVEIRFDAGRISMRNDGGSTHASVAFGSLTPVRAVEEGKKREALTRILDGEQPTSVLETYGFDESALADSVQLVVEQTAERDPVWRPARGVIRARSISLDGRQVVLVDG